MDISIFTLKPSGDTCDCIICRKKNVLRSDEHIIPMSLGGYAHTWNVCKDCNSNFGSFVDKKLINHYLITWERYFYKLKGESKKAVKSPLEGTFAGADGEPYRVIEENGFMVPHMLRPTFTLTPDGKQVTMAVDPKTKDPKKILEKYCKDNGLLYDPAQTIISSVQSSDSPWLNVSTTIDMSSFRLGMVKMAYEFAAELIPGYLSDPEAIKIASILENSSYDRIDEIEFGGNGITDIFPMIFKDVIDFTKKKRHYIFLANISGKMYCFVKLFDVFCLGIKLSDKSYPLADDNVILINDFENNSIHLFTILELISRVSSFESCGFSFMGDIDTKLQVIGGERGIGIYSASDGYNLCFYPNGKIMGSLSKVLSTIPVGQVDNQVIDGKSRTTYHINGSICFCMAPTKELLPLKEIILESSITKI